MSIPNRNPSEDDTRTATEFIETSRSLLRRLVSPKEGDKTRHKGDALFFHANQYEVIHRLLLNKFGKVEYWKERVKKLENLGHR